MKIIIKITKKIKINSFIFLENKLLKVNFILLIILKNTFFRLIRIIKKLLLK